MTVVVTGVAETEAAGTASSVTGVGDSDGETEREVSGCSVLDPVGGADGAVEGGCAVMATVPEAVDSWP